MQQATACLELLSSQYSASTGANISLMLQALRLFPAVVIVPTMQISWTLFSVVSGGIYYQEYLAFTAFTASMFGLGVLVGALPCLPACSYVGISHICQSPSTQDANKLELTLANQCLCLLDPFNRQTCERRAETIWVVSAKCCV